MAARMPYADRARGGSPRGPASARRARAPHRAGTPRSVGKPAAAPCRQAPATASPPSTAKVQPAGISVKLNSVAKPAAKPKVAATEARGEAARRAAHAAHPTHSRTARHAH